MATLLGRTRRVGVLGGTFNPIHNAHLSMVRDILAMGALNEALLMVANDPPHKPLAAHVPCKDRFRMAQLASEGAKGIQVSDLEMERPGKSYTVETLRALRTERPNAEFYWILGTDMLYDLPNWREAQTVFQLTGFLCIPRQGERGREQAEAERLKSQYGARIQILPIEAPAISSTHVRERVDKGLSIAALVPPAVEAYIYENGLYFPDFIRAMQENLRSVLNIHRYRHTMGVVRVAIDLAEQYGIDPEQARLAALLHDCGRSEDHGALTHAATSARLAAERYGVTDPAVLSAIRLHTTGQAGMSPLSQAIYLADLIEPNRDYPGVEGLRTLARQDLFRAMGAGLSQTIAYVRAKGQVVDPASLSALAWFS